MFRGGGGHECRKIGPNEIIRKKKEHEPRKSKKEILKSARQASSVLSALISLGSERLSENNFEEQRSVGRGERNKEFFLISGRN